MVLCHGFPECWYSWRHQLPALAALGFRAIAPDMRGYGRSSVYRQHADYAQELIVRDMIELLDSTGRRKAVWVGHDWGSPVVWNIASHHPDRCEAVASLCVPYHTIEYGLDYVIGLVDRELYPEKDFPAGQWDYMRNYEERFDEAIAPIDTHPRRFLKLAFRKGDPAGEGKIAMPAMARRQRRTGFEFPDVPRDADVISAEDLSVYASALERNGFFGPTSWYMNHETNAAYGRKASNDGYLDMPVLFIHARYDYVCETVHSRLAEPMRKFCRNLSEEIIRAGHWVAQEKPREVNAALVKWLASSVASIWPRPQ